MIPTQRETTEASAVKADLTLEEEHQNPSVKI